MKINPKAHIIKPDEGASIIIFWEITNQNTEYKLLLLFHNGVVPLTGLVNIQHLITPVT